jgi:hypothetical protein
VNKYNVYVWRGDGCGWKLRFRNVPKWRLRWRMRRLWAEAWDKPSVLVEQTTT